jgi:putative YhbY family RNA-binding protein
MKTLTPAERRALRARAHSLHPIVMIGNAGVTPGILKEIDLALKSHELIKMRMLGDDRDARASAFDRICDAVDASPVQLIGKILVIFRPRPEPEAVPPAPRPGKKARWRPGRAAAGTDRKMPEGRSRNSPGGRRKPGKPKRTKSRPSRFPAPRE